MKSSLRFFLLMFILASNVVFSASISVISTGSYSYTQQGDELIGGQKASITWNIIIKDSSNAVVTISSWHAPFTCEGSYTISNEKDYTALSWSGKNNEDSECDIPSPQILLKKSSSGRILIHSELFPWNNKGWQTVREIR
ncbi:hypothetical protein FGH87_26520 [Salmonella enterica]|uniref:Fimbrial protein n=1 Tax=Salmonella enterica subsp. enterica serovar Lattenkamp TaxID=2564671 RepID=A0A734FWC3_SALET|nr:hypothetical protein [Salmonella enterica]EBG2478061.1 hypothetical protein [Salmonella enterica subsp. enterica serovar Lattenkamp]EDS3899506.1 hypothetical protein [Salmonella enterica subsp. enterica]EAW5735705.1 hypothetical protein [Salmonella enterica]EAW6587219.1 hypothetical protein [Salmonella enterica]